MDDIECFIRSKQRYSKMFFDSFDDISDVINNADPCAQITFRHDSSYKGIAYLTNDPNSLNQVKYFCKLAETMSSACSEIAVSSVLDLTNLIHPQIILGKFLNTRKPEFFSGDKYYSDDDIYSYYIMSRDVKKPDNKYLFISSFTDQFKNYFSGSNFSHSMATHIFLLEKCLSKEYSKAFPGKTLSKEQFDFFEKQYFKMVAWDVLVNESDRHNSNWLIELSQSGANVCIFDNSYSFFHQQTKSTDYSTTSNEFIETSDCALKIPFGVKTAREKLEFLFNLDKNSYNALKELSEDLSPDKIKSTINNIPYFVPQNMRNYAINMLSSRISFLHELFKSKSVER